MPNQNRPKTCTVIRSPEKHTGKQGLDYFQGVSATSAQSQQLCMHLITVPPGGRANVHKHTNHETSIYILSGVAYTIFGEQLQHVVKSVPGDMLYIPSDVPHLPNNLGTEPVVGIVARTDPNEQESLVLLPELEEVAKRVIDALKKELQ